MLIILISSCSVQLPKLHGSSEEADEQAAKDSADAADSSILPRRTSSRVVPVKCSRESRYIYVHITPCQMMSMMMKTYTQSRFYNIYSKLICSIVFDIRIMAQPAVVTAWENCKGNTQEDLGLQVNKLCLQDYIIYSKQ